MVPSQITLMKALDRERMAICAAYGVKLPDAEAAFALEYSYEGDLYTMLKNAECYKGIMGPNSLQRTCRSACALCRSSARSPRFRPR